RLRGTLRRRDTRTTFADDRRRTLVIRIALIEPLGDLGIGTYAHELAEALVENGAEVDVFTSGAPAVMRLPRRHSLFPVLGSALIRQRNAIRDARNSIVDTRPGLPDMRAPTHAGSRRWTVPKSLSTARETYLNVELALWLRAHHYDVVWTQWPSPPVLGVSLWS